MTFTAPTRAVVHAPAQRGALLFAMLLALGCGADPAPRPAATEGALPAGVVARVGVSDLAGDTVARIATAQGLDLLPARDLAVHDALLEAEAHARGLDRARDVELATDAVLARRTLRGLLAAAGAAGPVTDEELRLTTEKHWLDLDRPDGVRTAHALVRLDEHADADKRKAASDVAEAVRRALAPVAAAAAGSAPRQSSQDVATEDEVIAPMKLAVGTVSHAGFEVVVEALPPVTADGRILQQPGGAFDPAYARAAGELTRRGELSGLVSSAFGVHVILLLERIPGQMVPSEERRALVRDEVLAARALSAERNLLEGLRPAVSIDRSVDGLLAKIAVEP